VPVDAVLSAPDPACSWVEPDRLKVLAQVNRNQLKFRTCRSGHGVLTITVSETLFRARVQGWIDGIKEEWG
jgi:hypothetical protein